MRKVFRKSPLRSALKMIMVLLPLALLFSIIWLRSNIVAVEYELGQLQKQKRALMSERIQLVAERAQLTSLEKIERLASRKFGLRYADRKKVFFIREVPPPVPYNTGFGESR